MLGGLAQPDATRKQQQQAAARAGMEISPQGLEQRFTPTAVAFMRQLLEAGLSQLVNGQLLQPMLSRFKGVYLTDCTRLEWGEVGVKMAVRWEIQSGQLQASLGDLLQHDSKTTVIDAPLPAGALQVCDLGFFKLTRLMMWNEAGVYWLTRFKVGTTLYDHEGRLLNLLEYLQSTSQPVVIPVKVGQAQVPCYLVAASIPPEAYAKRLARLKEQARLDQTHLSSRQRAFAPWTIYLTNVPDLTFEQAHILARTRWQIELLFKLWKSHGKVLISRSSDPIRQQCEGYAKLLGVLVAHWALLVSGWTLDTLGTLDAFRLVQPYVPLLMRALRQPCLWDWFFAWLSEDLQLAPPLTSRRRTPLAFQLWRAFDLAFP